MNRAFPIVDQAILCEGLLKGLILEVVVTISSNGDLGLKAAPDHYLVAHNPKIR